MKRNVCMNPWLQRREQVEREVRILREKISVLKIQISTITKGVPMSKIEVREDKRGLMRSSSPDEKFRSISLPTSGRELCPVYNDVFTCVHKFRKVPWKVVFPNHASHGSRYPQVPTIPGKWDPGLKWIQWLKWSDCVVREFLKIICFVILKT